MSFQDRMAEARVGRDAEEAKMGDEEFIHEYERQEWVSISEAARRTGISYSLIRRRIASGKLRSVSDPLDERVVLVSLEQIRKMIKPTLSQ